MKQVKFDVINSDDDLYNYKKGLRLDIVNDATFMNYLKRIGVNIENFDGFLNTIHDVFLSQKNCRNCQGLDFCKNDSDGYMAILHKDDDYLKKDFQKCPYRALLEKYYNSFIFHDFDEKYENLSISYLQGILENNAPRQKVANALLARLNGEKKWLYIAGITNSDKTRFSVAFCNDYIKKYKEAKIAFIKFRTLVENLSDLVFSRKEEFKERLNKLISCEVLVLDEFGDAYINSVSRDMIIIPLLNERAKEGNLTIFASQLGVREAVNRISAKDKIIEGPILGLFATKCQILKLENEVI